jgi:4-amino-4-deoxy-L-arabinose transferase-like glycosyltransferase
VTAAVAAPARWERRHTAIAVLALLIAAGGAARLPLDDHDVLVVQTAQEMRERRDWIVPYFLGKPRLNKPPLSYWLVAAAADASGSARATPGQGRLPSILAGVGVVALVMAIALAWLGADTAAIAGLIAASSTGFFRYTHSARPDMLYAFWCTLMLATFACGWRAVVLWLAAALATLTKGPQVPAMLLAAIVLVERRNGMTWRRIARRWQPVGGVALLLALTLPWWWAVHHALGGRGLAGTQLAGSLLAPTWHKLFDPYFFYRPLALVLPWTAVLLVALIRRRWPDDPRHLLPSLAVFVLGPALVFTLGTQRRPHYMLPALAPLCVALAMIARAALDGRHLRSAAAVLCAATITVEVAFVGSTALWSRERWVMQDLGRLAARALPSTTPLVALGPGRAAPSYYAGRPMRSVRSVTRLQAVLERNPTGQVGLLTERRWLAKLPAGASVTILGNGVVGNDDFVLAALGPPNRVELSQLPGRGSANGS